MTRDFLRYPWQQLPSNIDSLPPAPSEGKLRHLPLKLADPGGTKKKKNGQNNMKTSNKTSPCEGRHHPPAPPNKTGRYSHLVVGTLSGHLGNALWQLERQTTWRFAWANQHEMDLHGGLHLPILPCNIDICQYIIGMIGLAILLVIFFLGGNLWGWLFSTSSSSSDQSRSRIESPKASTQRTCFEQQLVQVLGCPTKLVKG